MTSAIRTVIRTEGAGQTEAVGRLLGERARPGDVLALIGGLGTGKTVFVKGLALGLGVPPGTLVTSPTFVLITEYRGRLTLYHVDAYRLERGRDFEALGADEILYGDGVCAVEWADRVLPCLPESRLDVAFEIVGAEARRVALTGRGAAWQERWSDLVSALDAEAAHGLK